MEIPYLPFPLPISLEFTTYQVYGMFFLLGSLVVSTISDIRKMAAQKEFFEFWLGFTVLMFFVDLYPFLGERIPNSLIAKWAILTVLCLLSWDKVGIAFRLAKMDMTAIAAVCSLFNVFWVVIFFPLLKLISMIEAPILESGDRYPFLPVVFTALTTILTLNLFYM